MQGNLARGAICGVVASWKQKPSLDELKRNARIFAGLDAVLCCDSPDTRYLRYYPDRTPGIDRVYLQNGAGDYLEGAFGPEGALFKVFDHESELSPYQRDDEDTWPGIWKGVPAELLVYVEDFETDRKEATLVVYRQTKGPWKQTVPEDPPEDASEGWWLMTQLDMDCKEFLCWAPDYYECELPKKVVQAIYSQGRITPEQAAALVANKELDQPFHFAQIKDELARLKLIE